MQSHRKTETVQKGASLSLLAQKGGSQPLHYLWGTTVQENFQLFH